MFRRATRRYKFLSITTVGNRLLFHVPIKRRNSIYNKYKDELNIYIPIDPRDKNQIDITLKDIDSFECVKELIDIAYEERE